MLGLSRRRASAWAPALAYMAAIFFFSAQSTFPAPIVDLLVFVKDKTLHVLEYALLTALFLRAARIEFPRACPIRAALYSALAAALYGLSDEWHQLYTPGRTADLGDWLADCLGAILLAALFLYYRKRRYGALHACPAADPE